MLVPAFSLSVRVRCVVLSVCVSCVSVGPRLPPPRGFLIISLCPPVVALAQILQYFENVIRYLGGRSNTEYFPEHWADNQAMF